MFSPSATPPVVGGPPVEPPHLSGIYAQFGRQDDVEVTQYAQGDSVHADHHGFLNNHSYGLGYDESNSDVEAGVAQLRSAISALRPEDVAWSAAAPADGWQTLPHEVEVRVDHYPAGGADVPDGEQWAVIDTQADNARATAVAGAASHVFDLVRQHGDRL
jgi:hypothetical protein